MLEFYCQEKFCTQKGAKETPDGSGGIYFDHKQTSLLPSFLTHQKDFCFIILKHLTSTKTILDTLCFRYLASHMQKS